jgi:hypothetical protein
MYINAVGSSVMMYLQHDFCKIIFKIKHKLFVTSASAPTPRKNPGCASAVDGSNYKPIVSNDKQIVEWQGCGVEYSVPELSVLLFHGLVARSRDKHEVISWRD